MQKLDRFRYPLVLQRMAKGVKLTKLQSRKPGVVSEVVVGVDLAARALWWTSPHRHRILFLKDIVRLEYGAHCPAVRSIGDYPNRADPWNSFSLITKSRSFDFCGVSDGGVEAFLLDFSMIARNELPYRERPKGLFATANRLRWARALMKLDSIPIVN